MNIEEFKVKFASFKDSSKIEIECDHPKHNGEMITIGKQPAKRNILKNNGEKFICRNCYMKYNNPMNNLDDNRQTEELINVYCPHEEHKGNSCRQIKKRNYYGSLNEPYIQTCKSCSQLGREVNEEQKERIRLALTGIKRSDDFKQKISEYMKKNPEGIARGIKNLFENHCTTGMLGKTHSDETKLKMSETHSGKEFTEEHCENISEGRKAMLNAQGGFTREHRENISKAVIKQYKNGFNPNLHHISGWHESLKAGRIFYRSSYEKKAYLKLDKDVSVKTYFAEKVNVKYFNPIKKITSSYIIDLLIEYVDETQKLVEIKPEKWLKNEIVICKINAGKLHAENIGMKFEVWTEMDLFGHVYNDKNMKLFVEKIKNGDV